MRLSPTICAWRWSSVTLPLARHRQCLSPLTHAVSLNVSPIHALSLSASHSRCLLPGNTRRGRGSLLQLVLMQDAACLQKVKSISMAQCGSVAGGHSKAVRHRGTVRQHIIALRSVEGGHSKAMWQGASEAGGLAACAGGALTCNLCKAALTQASRA